MSPRFIIICLLYCVAISGCATHAWLTMQQTTEKTALPPGAPRYSDVCFSSRWERPRDANDTLETFNAAKSFHATYLNWVYTTNPHFIRKADSLGYKLQVALTPTLHDLPLGSTNSDPPSQSSQSNKGQGGDAGGTSVGAACFFAMH